MRAAVPFVALLLLAGCKDEPQFEDRYAKAAKEIDARAKAMDADIAKSDQADAKDLSAPPKPSNAPPSSGE
ncbi:hypothetical protein [Sphingopyxis sp.]|uniref:hypothetical protein n=1 Tax=Sphingopyxis sp. TaxID=1908224 RepID=UPI002EDB0BB8